jgi:hypothetical protein
MNTDLPPFSQTTLLPTIGPVGSERPAESKPRIAKAQLDVLFQTMGVLLERLWVFYQAMRNGRPIGNSDEMLAEMRGVFTKAKEANHGVEDRF